MSLSDWPRFVGMVRTLVDLPEDELVLFLGAFSTRSYGRGKILLQGGAICQHLWFLEAGMVRYSILEGDREVNTNFSLEGEWTTNYVSFLTKTPSTLTLDVLEPITALELNYESLQKLYATLPQMNLLGRLIAEANFVEIVNQYNTLLSLTPLDHYQYLLAHKPKWLQRLPQKQIASYLGITPESLSRLRRRLAAQQA